MILITYGTRPEYIKVKPLIDEMKQRFIAHKVLFTGQHKDIAPKDADFIWEMIMDAEENRLNSVIKNCLSIPEYVFDGVTHILVQGDTTSVVGLALSAMNRQIKIIHLEAGLRTYDRLNPYPEENNRRMVSSIADIHFCPTEQSKINLAKENIGKDVFVVGNTVLDNLLDYKESCKYEDKVLVTMHRRENHKDMGRWFKEINELARENPHIDFIIPLHPNPKVQKHHKLLSNLIIVDPLPHDKLINLLTKCKLVITDSGGLQEECSFFNKRCLVCRETTERPEALEHSSVLVKDYTLLKRKFYNYITNYEIVDGNCPFGDGRASKYICDNLIRNVLQ
jgi:UDP-N-acetylglucosamine 2-epimerase